MSETESDPASVPLLFPDPVIEFYLAKIDRAALREQLQKTPDERLRALQEKRRQAWREQESVMREDSPRWSGKKGAVNVSSDAEWFAEAKAVPLLVHDPITETYLEDVDRGLIRQASKLSVPERFERFHRLMESAYALRRACAEQPPNDR